MIWTVAQNDFRRRLKAPLGIVILLVIPLVMAVLIGAIFSPGQSVLPKTTILVSDQDGGLVARFLAQALSAGDVSRMFSVRMVDRQTGDKQVAAGKASALLIIPPGFSARLLNGEAAELQLLKNPSERYLPLIAEEFSRTLAVALSALIRVFWDEIQLLRGYLGIPLESLPASSLLPFLEKAKLKLMSVRRVVSPLLISLKKEVQQQKAKGQEISVFAYILPGMMVLFLFFIVQTVMEDILREKEAGTLRRILTSPLPEGRYILGKILGSFLVGVVSYWLMLGAGALLFGLKARAWWYHLPFSAAICFFAAAFFAMIYAFVRNERQAGAITTPLILIFGVMGGSMIPIDQLGGGFRAISRFTPNYWFITGSHRIATGVFPWQSLSVLLAFGFVCFLVAYSALKKKVALR